MTENKQTAVIIDLAAKKAERRKKTLRHYNCTFIGSNAWVDESVTENITNSTAIGYKVKIKTSNTIVFGNEDVNKVVCGEQAAMGIGEDNPAYLLHCGNNNKKFPPFICIESAKIPECPVNPNAVIISVYQSKLLVTTHEGTKEILLKQSLRLRLLRRLLQVLILILCIKYLI